MVLWPRLREALIRMAAALLVLVSVSFWAGMFMLIEEVIRVLTRNQ